MAAQCATDTGNNPLWDYALGVYRLPGMANELLRLQDTQDCDVLWLLTALWLAEKGVTLTAADLVNTEYDTCRRERILPLRAQRRACDKHHQRDEYDALKTAELDAEREGLGLLFQALSDRPQDGGGRQHNLSLLTSDYQPLLALLEHH